MSSLLRTFRDYLEPHWFWNGLYYLGWAVLGIYLIFRFIDWLRDQQNRRQ